MVARVPADARSGVEAALPTLGQGSGWTPAGEPAWSADGTVVNAIYATGTGASQTEVEDAVVGLRAAADLRLPQAGAGEWAVGGDAGYSQEYTQRHRDRTPWVIAVVLTLTALMIVVAFRSPVLGLITTLLNLASVGVAFGTSSCSAGSGRTCAPGCRSATPSRTGSAAPPGW